MPTYAIGDLQGCHTQLRRLLDRIDSTEADGDTARYVFVGDLVNRGPESLATLRHVHALGDRATTVLGNHDLHLLAAAHGRRKQGRSDSLGPILDAPDRDELLDWLRRQPLACMEGDKLIVHAGVLPQWTAAQAVALSGEVERTLQGPDWIDFLQHMYGNQPPRWDDALAGHDRLRCIVNAMTRMRLCTADGMMILDEGRDAAGSAPETGLPWFDAPARRTADMTVVFGHWSAIGLQMRPDLIGLDTGCLWGGKLTAVRLEDRALFQVDCPQHHAPASSFT